MGDILQTPQFQMRRLKKQLADERSNRDELELELAENRQAPHREAVYLAHWRTCVDGRHLGFSSRKVLGLSEVWLFCLLCCLPAGPSWSSSLGPLADTWKLVLSMPPTPSSLDQRPSSLLTPPLILG